MERTTIDYPPPTPPNPPESGDEGRGWLYSAVLGFLIFTLARAGSIYQTAQKTPPPPPSEEAPVARVIRHSDRDAAVAVLNKNEWKMTEMSINGKPDRRIAAGDVVIWCFQPFGDMAYKGADGKHTNDKATYRFTNDYDGWLYIWLNDPTKPQLKASTVRMEFVMTEYPDATPPRLVLKGEHHIFDKDGNKLKTARMQVNLIKYP